MKPAVGTAEHLVSAAKAGEIAGVEEAIAAKVDINARDQHGHTALAHAVRHPEVVELLLNRGADPNIANNWQETPLDLACTVGDKQTALLLVEHGAQINHRDYQGRTPLGEGITRGYWDIAEYLLRNGAIWSIADCMQATRQYVKPSSFDSGDADDLSMMRYVTFLYKVRNVSPDAEAALDLAVHETLPDTARGTMVAASVDGIAGFKVEVAEGERHPIVLISNNNGSAQFRLNRHLLNRSVELDGDTQLDGQDIEAAAEVIKANFDAIIDIWKWHRFWHSMEAT